MFPSIITGGGAVTLLINDGFVKFRLFLRSFSDSTVLIFLLKRGCGKIKE